MKNNFLFEIGCEELPPKNLIRLSEALADNIKQGLIKANLTFGDIHPYATPRRLAVMIKDLISEQPDQSVERKGPAVTAPTAALEGFLRSNNISADQVSEEDGRVIYRFVEKGKNITQLMPEIISKAIADLPISKPMRWSDKDIYFIRPVHWIVMLYGEQVIPATILGLVASNKTYGHRFHHPQSIELKHCDNYLTDLEKVFVIVDNSTRKNKISDALQKLSNEKNGNYLSSSDLLNEVTSIVEWPVPLLGSFDKTFLTVPKEALIAAMQGHQKCFPIKNTDETLLPNFITISNIQSTDTSTVIHGNERVMQARLSDAKFFYETDCKETLESRLEKLKHVIFQAKLGTLYDKSQRISKLASFIATQLNLDTKLAARAGLLCKADLVSNMVNEFPELQGLMGYYYALNDNEDKEVAIAIRDQYKNPTNTIGYCVALADRLDTLIEMFRIDQIPTGDKDPFGLRRAAIGILTIIIEQKLPLNLMDLIKEPSLIAKTEKQCEQIYEFVLERLPGFYQNKITADVIAAVLATTNHKPYDIHLRIAALQQFRSLPEAAALTEANKRASNLLKKSAAVSTEIDSNLFKHESEQQLFAALQSITISDEDYSASLKKLSTLQTPVANFFDNVMVMDEDEKLRNNRLALLAALRHLFLQIADISLLQH